MSAKADSVGYQIASSRDKKYLNMISSRAPKRRDRRKRTEEMLYLRGCGICLNLTSPDEKEFGVV